MQIAMHSLSATMHCSAIAPSVIGDCFGLKCERAATPAENASWMPVVAAISAWVTSIFWRPLLTGNRSVNPESVVTTGHAYCLRQGDHPKVLLNLAWELYTSEMLFLICSGAGTSEYSTLLYTNGRSSPVAWCQKCEFFCLVKTELAAGALRFQLARPSFQPPIPNHRRRPGSRTYKVLFTMAAAKETRVNAAVVAVLSKPGGIFIWKE